MLESIIAPDLRESLRRGLRAFNWFVIWDWRGSSPAAGCALGASLHEAGFCGSLACSSSSCLGWPVLNWKRRLMRHWITANGLVCAQPRRRVSSSGALLFSLRLRDIQRDDILEPEACFLSAKASASASEASVLKRCWLRPTCLSRASSAHLPFIQLRSAHLACPRPLEAAAWLRGRNAKRYKQQTSARIN